MREEDTMRWSEQAEDLAKALTEAQKKMWESWFDLMRAAPVSLPLSRPVADQWREMALQGLKTWTAESEQVVKDVAERLATTQDVVMRFLDLSVSAWKAMAPQIESARIGKPGRRIMQITSANSSCSSLKARPRLPRTLMSSSDSI